MTYFKNIKTTSVAVFLWFVYILVTGIFTSFVLFYYSKLLQPIIPPSHLFREYAICFGQILFQITILLLLKTQKLTMFRYSLNMMTVSLLGGILLLPMLVFPLLTSSLKDCYFAWFFIVVVFMFFNHKKRIEKIEAPFWLTYTWVLYRCLVLLIIL